MSHKKENKEKNVKEMKINKFTCARACVCVCVETIGHKLFSTVFALFLCTAMDTLEATRLVYLYMNFT